MFLSQTMMVTGIIFYLILRHVSGMLYGPRLLISPVGGSVTIKCYYLATTANRHDRKYLCKESKFSHKRCQTIISTNHFIFEEYKGRVSMEDNPHNGILKVTMTELEKKDSSNYRCGIGRINNGLYAGVNLTVWEGADLPKAPKIIWGKLRGSVMIQCSLETTTRSTRNSLCKISKSGCIPIADENRHRQQDGRIIITMKNSPGMVNVIINELRTQDSGIYRCGMGPLDDIAKMMQLQVVEESVFSNIVSEINATYEPHTMYTPFHGHVVTTANEVSKESSRSSQAEQNLLAIVLPIMIVLLVFAAIAITVLIKTKQWRKKASYDIPARGPEGEVPPSSPRCSEEQPKQENRVLAEEQDSAVATDNVDTPVASVYCLVSKTPVLEDCESD